jgi:hypothetical protein
MKSLTALLLSAATAAFALAGVARGGVVQADLKALTRSGTTLIGISSGGEVKRSTDSGATFSTTRAAGSTALLNLNASGATVVAVGDAGFIVRSVDTGATWAEAPSPAFTGELLDVAAKDGAFWVAVGKANSNVTALWSNNGGASWSFATVPAISGSLRGVVYDAGTARWTAVGSDGFLGARILTSTDGMSWSSVTPPSGSAPLNDVASDEAGNLLAVGEAGTLLTSANGGQGFVTDANSGLVASDNLNTVVYSATSGFAAGGQDLVQVNYTTGGGATLAQAPVPGGGDIVALVVSATGEVIATGDSFTGYQSITFAGPGDQALSASPVTLSATASSGLAVTFSVVSGPATILGSQLTLTGEGTVVVRASQAGNTSFNAAAPVERTIVVSKTAATVTLANLSAVYDGSAKSATATTTPAGLTVTLTYAGSSTPPTNAGSYAVVGTIADAAYAGSASGTLTIAQASQTITFAALSDVTLSVGSVALSASASSGIPVVFSVVSGPATVSGNTLTLTGGGTVTVRAAQSGNVNYAAATSVERSFVVTSNVATVTLENLTATYDGSPKPVTTTVSPTGLNVTLTYDGSSTAPTNAGSYAVLATVNDTTYQGSASGTLVIAKADQSISFPAPVSLPFSTTPVTLNATATSGLAVAYSVVSGPATISGNSLTLTGAGSVVVNATQAGNSNYNPAPGSSVTISISINFESWRAGYFTTGELADLNVSGPNAVFGLDGLSNLVKYALGLAPKTDALTGIPELSTSATDWVYRFSRPSVVVDVTCAVEVSTNLTAWTEEGVTLELTSSAGGVDNWEARYPLSSAPNAFFRLKVTLNPPTD